MLEESGFHIDKQDKHPPRFYLFDDERRQQAEFTEEEAQLLRQTLAVVPESNPLLAALRQKIYLHSTLLPLADGLIDLHQGRIVGLLAEAIRDRRQVRLLRYHSVHSHTISDRIVEPHSFSDDFAQLTVYEPATAAHKTFKTQRIEDVEVLDDTADTATDRNPDGPLWLARRRKKGLAAAYLSGLSPINGRIPDNPPRYDAYPR